MDLTNRKIFKLRGRVQPYAWGGHEFIPTLLGEAPGSKPAAEYWLGTHELGPAEVVDGVQSMALNHLIAANPIETIGDDVYREFGRLPYLLKILDVKDMLSIQVHPGKVAAEQEFARETQEGIALDDSKRNYKDDNHKPEADACAGVISGCSTASSRGTS